jgi:hypothetical protein
VDVVVHGVVVVARSLWCPPRWSSGDAVGVGVVVAEVDVEMVVVVTTAWWS